MVARAALSGARRLALRQVVVILVAAMAAATVITVAFGGDEKPNPGVVIEWLERKHTPEPTGSATATSGTTSEGPTPTAGQDGATPGASVTGFAYPIAGGCLPQSDDLMPNAPRAYRNGIHEGVDFYNADNCVEIGLDTPVLAAKAGRVIRADWDYQPLTESELAALEARITAGAVNDPVVEDVFRGRQVWIDHGDGIVTRYAHLNGIAEGIEEGTQVDQRQLIAYVGDSGTPESVSSPGTELHLHFEVRVGDSYLGAGLPVDEMRQLYAEAFSSP